VSDKGLLSRFDALRRQSPSRPLVHLPGVGATWSASDVWNAHLEIAEALRGHGVSAGHLVVSAAGNAPDSVPLLLACRALGAALMPVDAGAPRVEIDALAERFGAVAIAEVGRVTARDTAQPRHYPNAAVLKLTSGSTGTPKAAVTTEAQLVADATHIIAAMGIRPEDTQIAAIPVSHSYGLGNLMLPLLLQGTAFVLRESFVPHQLPSDARRFRARVFPGVPFMFEYFLANAPADGWPSTLQLLISAGAPLAPSTARLFHERYGVKIHSFYGTTETGGIAYDNGDAIDDRGAVGRTMPGVTVTLRIEDCGLPIDDDAPRKPQVNSQSVPRSATRNPQSGMSPVGRVHVVSDAVASGYSSGDDDAFVDGGFLTGDRASFDARQQLVLVGRVSSFVNVAGRKVQPDEVEHVLRAMPGIGDVRVVAAADSQRGQQLVACIVAATPGELTTLAVRQFCASRLAPHKIPRSVVFLDVIPLTARGKTDRAALDQLVRARIGAEAM
jgi:long-chain acyl-CoA synthetase